MREYTSPRRNELLKCLCHNLKSSFYPLPSHQHQCFPKKRSGGCSKFCQVCSHCETALTVIIANQRQHKSVMEVLLGRQGIWAVIVHHFTEGLRNQKFWMMRSTFDQLCNAVGLLVAPATSCPREPLPTNQVSCHVICKCEKKLFTVQFCKIRLLSNRMKYYNKLVQNLFLDIWEFYRLTSSN